MSKQYHYVAVYDTGTKEWSIDFDVSINYDEGNVWDTKTQEWSYPQDDLDEDLIIGELTTKLIGDKK